MWENGYVEFVRGEFKERGSNRMNEFGEVMEIPDEMLASVVGGVFSDEDRAQFRTISQQLKNNGYPFNNAMAWLHEQCAGYRWSAEEWQEIEDIVRSVYES